ncbi:MAG: hypothetical protein AUH39_01650 [Chloroflexi bacterium 13_1_40CM_67_9]|nr:MAG: hypothetical protein AUH39_01650 [Chloroflexi bacterium 13_1_40CM_67_9]
MTITKTCWLAVAGEAVGRTIFALGEIGAEAPLDAARTGDADGDAAGEVHATTSAMTSDAPKRVRTR